MNYHNFASRLTTHRLPAIATKEIISKPAPKKSGGGADGATPRRKR